MSTIKALELISRRSPRSGRLRYEEKVDSKAMRTTNVLMYLFISINFFTCSTNESIEHKIEYYDNAKRSKKSEYNYKNGVLNGEALTYYPSGALREKMFFNNGKMHGKAYGYLENGSVSVLNYFENGQIVQFESFYPSGRLEKKWIYEKNFVKSKLGYSESGVLNPIEFTVAAKIEKHNTYDSISFTCLLDNLEIETLRDCTLVLTEKTNLSSKIDTLAIIRDKTTMLKFSIPKPSTNGDSIFFDYRLIYASDSINYYRIGYSKIDLFRDSFTAESPASGTPPNHENF